MSFDKGVEKKCKNKGIAIIKQEGDMVVIVEDKLTTF
jgi:orotate phosphoribosyltransferase